MKQQSLSLTLEEQKAFFETRATYDLAYRIAQLKKLKTAIKNNEQAIIAALQQDLGKPELEAYFSAIHMCTTEIDYAIKHLHAWAKKRSVTTPLALWPMRSAVQPQPYGTVLIISTWNYPFNLNLIPLIGAIAAGNCAIIKPSPRAAHSEKLLIDMINATFDNSYVHCLAQIPTIVDEMLAQQWDYIFLTGHAPFAKQFMRNAAEHITPIALELGGKSPCIVDQTAQLTTAAQKITWGKWMNAGQNCISPDYVLVHTSIKELLLQNIQQSIVDFYGNNQEESASYGKIIDGAYIDRLENLLQGTHIVCGGIVNKEKRYMAPTIVEIDSLDHPLMQEEIFGPILPVITFDTIDQALTIYRHNPDPLAVYLFSQDKHIITKVQHTTRSGAFGINELVLQVASHYLPFGGIGASGIGRYHGKASFDLFSNERAIIESRWFDLPFRYPQYKKIRNWFKKILSWL